MKPSEILGECRYCIPRTPPLEFLRAKEVKNFHENQPLSVGFLVNMKFLQKNWTAAAILVILIVIAGYFVSTNVYKQGKLGSATTTQVEQAKKVKASITINLGGNGKASQDVEVEEGKTALDLTRQVTDVETKGDGADAFVTGLGGEVADTNKNEFWEFLVNDKPAEVGAGSYKVKNGDKIEWRIATY